MKKVGDRSTVVLALLFIACFETPDECYALVENVQDRVSRCESAQKQAYILVVERGARAYACPKPNGKDTNFLCNDKEVCKVIEELSTQSNGEASTLVSASTGLDDTPVLQDIAKEVVCPEEQLVYKQHLQNIHTMVEDYLDTHKENAFKSALQEPARFYYDLCSKDHGHRDHVNVHGLNGYLCLVRGWFGFQLPLIPMDNDPDTYKGCTNMWEGLFEEAWAKFSDPEYFGKSFERVKGLKGSMLKSYRYARHDTTNSFCNTNKNAAEIEREAKQKNPIYKECAEKFAFFFRKDFLVKRMFEGLNAACKPECIGFKASCDILYPLFKKRYNLYDKTTELTEYLYDENYTNLDIDKAAHFLWWCGVCNEDHALIDVKSEEATTTSTSHLPKKQRTT